MPRKARVKSASGIYHIMLRGANRQEIFHDDTDSMKFLDILKKYKSETGMKVYAWCLMSNHIHLLIGEGGEGLAVTMKRIGVSYVSYYNRKYQTNGHLFQDRFRSEIIDSGRYFMTVIRYIHQNPIKAGIAGRVEEWRWSSCAGYYDRPYYPGGLLDRNKAYELFSHDRGEAEALFREFNERENSDECLGEQDYRRRSMPDEEARVIIKEMLGETEIAQVKSLPKEKRVELLKRIKTIEGISQRQAARILGISASLVFKV